jgi:small subunit ribosomal protein S6e
MELKTVVSNPSTGKSYQLDVKDDKAKTLRGKKIGDEVDGAFLGLSGYKLAITGGSDKSGFPMRTGIHGGRRVKVLMDAGVGYNPGRDERRRKRVHGEKIEEDVVQVNMKVSSAGKKSIEELLGIKTGEKQEEAKPTAEEKPKEKGKKAGGEA